MNTIKNKKETWSDYMENSSQKKSGEVTQEDKDRFVASLNPEAREFLYTLTQKSKRMNEVFADYFIQKQ